MQVRYIHEQIFANGEKALSNIMWDLDGVWPSNLGEFPELHPMNSHAEGLSQFKARGYKVCHFREGDGCSLDLEQHRPREKVIQDIRECLGWKVL